MTYRLLRYEDNWADEMDLEGIYVFSKEKEYEKFIEQMKILKKSIKDGNEFVFSVGSNEEITYSDEEYDIKECYSIKKITEEEFKILKKLRLINIGFAYDFVKQVLDFKEDDDDDNDED